MAGPSATGRCLCGGIRFELLEPAQAAGYCHCTRCQRRTGSASSAQARIDPWEPLPDDELERYAEGKPRS